MEEGVERDRKVSIQINPRATRKESTVHFRKDFEPQTSDQQRNRKYSSINQHDSSTDSQSSDSRRQSIQSRPSGGRRISSWLRNNRWSVPNSNPSYGSHGSLHRASYMGAIDSHGREVKYQNSYRIDGPKKSMRFKVKEAERIMNEILTRMVESEVYSPHHSPRLARLISDVIKNRIKALNSSTGPDRYKYICMVSIGERCNQGLDIFSRGLWDNMTDTSVTVEYTNSTLFAVATLFAVYCEGTAAQFSMADKLSAFDYTQSPVAVAVARQSVYLPND